MRVCLCVWVCVSANPIVQVWQAKKKCHVPTVYMVASSLKANKSVWPTTTVLCLMTLGKSSKVMSYTSEAKELDLNM